MHFERVEQCAERDADCTGSGVAVRPKPQSTGILAMQMVRIDMA
jgi:hypothetical protein